MPEKRSLVAYDAAILDLGLPDGDGLEVLAEARRAGKNIPALVLTARDAVEDRVRGLDAGCDDYLIKPCDDRTHCQNEGAAAPAGSRSRHHA